MSKPVLNVSIHQPGCVKMHNYGNNPPAKIHRFVMTPFDGLKPVGTYTLIQTNEKIQTVAKNAISADKRKASEALVSIKNTEPAKGIR